jgi:kumamolisin
MNSNNMYKVFVVIFFVYVGIILFIALYKEETQTDNVAVPVQPDDNPPSIPDLIPTLKLKNYSFNAHSAPSPNLPNNSVLKFKNRYQYPAQQNTSKKPIICVISLGGSFKTSDMQAYWTACGNSGNAPTITVHNVDSSPNRANQFGVVSKDPASVENTLDLQIAMTLCPSAEMHIVFGRNSFDSFFNALQYATNLLKSKSNETYGAKVVSISWGLCELYIDIKTVMRYNNMFKDGVSNGITYCAASGDSGSSDGFLTNLRTTLPAVDFPASCPWVVSCGGTSLNGNVETPWIYNSSKKWGGGGGFSMYFPGLQFQQDVIETSNVPVFIRNSALIKNRSVPDIALNADPTYGWAIYFNGKYMTVGGTSCVSPAMSAYFGLLNRNDFTLNDNALTSLYANKNFLNDVMAGGSNDSTGLGLYFPGVGLDGCTGLGTLPITLANSNSLRSAMLS